MDIQLRNQQISHGCATVKTRSRELIRFVGYLAWKFKVNGTSEWIRLEELRGIIGTAHPKQYQRYIDTLTNAGLSIIEFKTKTGGPWRLSESIKTVAFDMPDDEIKNQFVITAQNRQSIYFNDELFFDITRKLTDADLCFHNGQLDESVSLAKSILFFGEEPKADAELQVLTYLRIARACGRLTMFDEAIATLDSATQLLKQQSVNFHDLNIKVLLAKAKVFFDRGNIQHASAILDALPIHDCRDSHTLAQYHNLAGLFIHRRLRLDMESGNTISEEMLNEWLDTCKTHYQRSLVSHLFLNDYHSVQAACFNLGNLFAFALKQYSVLEKERYLEQAIHWLTLSEVICNKHGVGGESVWALLLLTDTGISNNISISKLKSMTGNLFHTFTSYLDISAWIYTEAKNIGNRLEIAEACHLLARVLAKEGSIEKAKQNAIESIDLFLEAGRKDMARGIKKFLAEITAPSLEKAI